ncbi:MAG: small subunit ribosomal protein [Thermotogaceae bacterium]|jgi:small subunit ribosomal protein S20|nr:small subunit ribosomal protein [Thermotogaceae bacterium]
MPQHKSAMRRVKRSEKEKLQNKIYRSKFKNLTKKINRALEEGNVETANEMLPKAFSAIDRAAKIGTIHKNQAARRKSRLVKRIDRAQAQV